MPSSFSSLASFFWFTSNSSPISSASMTQSRDTPLLLYLSKETMKREESRGETIEQDKDSENLLVNGFLSLVSLHASYILFLSSNFNDDLTREREREREDEMKTTFKLSLCILRDLILFSIAAVLGFCVSCCRVLCQGIWISPCVSFSYDDYRSKDT